jgi:hypothetical protein
MVPKRRVGCNGIPPSCTKYIHRRIPMSDEKEHRVEFSTETEGEAFIHGVTFLDSDVATEGPFEEVNGDGDVEWVVIVRQFA